MKTKLCLENLLGRDIFKDRFKWKYNIKMDFRK